MQAMVSMVLVMLGLYAACGVVVAARLHAGALRRIDPAVTGAGWGFRLLITPGLVALWPAMVRRALAVRRGVPVGSPYDTPLRAAGLRSLQRLATQVLAILAPLALVAILSARSPVPTATDEATEPDAEAVTGATMNPATNPPADDGATPNTTPTVPPTTPGDPEAVPL